MDGEALPAPTAPLDGGAHARFMTAGSVDDGKSTVIGRLLLDAGALMRDEAERMGDDEEVDLAALTDGLEAEREQGITIDVAYRYFTTPGASFIIADAPGHEQYTRNMVTAASVSDIAVIVIDVAGVVGGQVKPQTRRHAAIAALMGLEVIVAVNKMDSVGWSEERFNDVRQAFAKVAATLNLSRIAYVPVSAKRGDNVVRRGGALWWRGPTLLEVVEQARPQDTRKTHPLRLPVQTSLRDGMRRYYAGRIAAGRVRVGDKVAIGAGGHIATVARVLIGGEQVARAEAGDSVAVEFAEDRDVVRGDVIAAPGARYVRKVSADICWLDEDDWRKGQRYVLRQGTLETPAFIESIEFVRSIDDLSAHPSDALALNDIASVTVSTRDPILADIYAEAPGASAFVLFNPQTNQTCAAGMIRRSDT